MKNFQEELIKALGNLKNFVPVGTPWWGFDVKAKPIGVQLYQGQVLARSMYPVHWDYIQSYRTIVSDAEWHTYADAHGGFCPYFSSGDNVGTYRMPKIVDVHPRFCYWGDDVGKYIEAGLPNITGSVGTNQLNDYQYTGLLGYRVMTNKIQEGALDWDTNVYGIAQNGGSTSEVARAINKLTINANRCSSVYGAADTVQPPAVNMLVGEYVVSGISEFDIVTSNEITKGIDALQTEVGKVIKEDRLNALLAKYNTSYITKTWSSGTEWYRVWSNGWIEQGGSVPSIPSGNYKDFVLPTTFKNTNYTLVITNNSSYYGAGQANDIGIKLSSSTIRIHSGHHQVCNFGFYACGY
jgi:hypothetical protein